jgi:ribose 5-phosphate isomerase A
VLSQNQQKKIVGEKAIEFISSDSVVGLGTGSTVDYFLQKLAAEINSGSLKNILGVATSKATEDIANSLGIPIASLNDKPVIDITIDGADEIDQNYNLIKGGGGALLREKIVAQASKQMVVIADSCKISEKLFSRFYLPIEVVRMSLNSELKYLTEIGSKPQLRKGSDEMPFITDEGNYIVDSEFEIGTDPILISSLLNERAGIVEHGLFINMCKSVITIENGFAKIFEKSQEILKLKSDKK